MKIITNNDGSKTIDFANTIILSKNEHAITVTRPTMIPGVRNSKINLKNGNVVSLNGSFKYKLSLTLRLIEYVWFSDKWRKDRNALEMD